MTQSQSSAQDKKELKGQLSMRQQLCGEFTEDTFTFTLFVTISHNNPEWSDVQVLYALVVLHAYLR